MSVQAGRDLHNQRNSKPAPSKAMENGALMVRASHGDRDAQAELKRRRLDEPPPNVPPAT